MLPLADLLSYLLCWQESILDMEVNDLLDGGSGIHDDHSPPFTIIDSSHSQTLSQGPPKTDATKPTTDNERQLTADHSKVPSFSDDASADIYQTSAESPSVAGDLDIFQYVALGATIAVMVSAFYMHLVKK